MFEAKTSSGRKVLIEKPETLRDYFAGQVLASIAFGALKETKRSAEDIAGVCYQIADAMLAHRERKGEGE